MLTNSMYVLGNRRLPLSCVQCSRGEGVCNIRSLEAASDQTWVVEDVRSWFCRLRFISEQFHSIGRKDDVMTLANSRSCLRLMDTPSLMFSAGEKIVPLPQEGHITSSPIVLGCVMFGHGREQPGILIEPALSGASDPHDSPALVRFRDRIW